MTTRVLPAIRAIRCRSSWVNSSRASRSLMACKRSLRTSQSALRSTIVRSSCFASSFRVVSRSVALRSRSRNSLIPLSSGVIDKSRSTSFASSSSCDRRSTSARASCPSSANLWLRKWWSIDRTPVVNDSHVAVS